jgi:hypothetical protein
MHFGSIVHDAEHFIASPIGQAAIHLGEEVPGPIGLISHGIEVVNDVAQHNYLAAIEDVSSML